MFRTLLSVVAVLLLAAIAVLLYVNCSMPTRNTGNFAELTGLGAPPSAPLRAPEPARQLPTLAPQPVVTAPPAPPKASPPPTEPIGKRTHVVRAGESLSSISRIYYGSPEHHRQIAQANGLRSRDVIRVGQVLYVPEIPGVQISEKPSEEFAEKQQPETKADASESADFEPMPPTLSTVKKDSR
jgi:LysM repeat protein